MEALILLLNMAAMVHLCWRIFKLDPATQQADLGWFAYRQDSNDA